MSGVARAASLPTMKGMTRLSTVKPAEQEWVWDAMIPRATLTLLAGRGGGSKSTLATHLAAKLTTGDLPGMFRGQPVSVAYMTAENDPERVMVPRLMAAGADLDRVLVFDDKLRFPQDQDEALRVLERAEVRVLFIDPLMAYFSQLGSYEKAVDTLTPMLEACARRDITVVGITHVTKSAKKPTANALFGSAGLATTARQALVVGETRDAKVVGVVKSNVGADRQGWVFHVSYGPLEDYPTIDAPTVRLERPALTSELDRMWEDRDTDTADDRVLSLLELLAEGEMESGAAQSALCKQFDIKDRSARNVIGVAVSRHLVARTTEGVGPTRTVTIRIAEAGELLRQEA